MKLTTEQIAAIEAAVLTYGQQRAAAQGFRFNEVDFMAGAMTVYFALGNQGDIPAQWIFGPLGGRSALGLERSPTDALEEIKARVDHLTEWIDALRDRVMELEEAAEDE